ncbi:uncharacterized protein LOC119980363 [Tripterygium wilfordii]|uniref:uncharacterized protein LOC119980363 n=1 Tax=Tripterygium wilfordii TaxID=458696 RepID=UPI0018F851C2|nr:uncharacterized protein LOC119980363 [Tripterygium wilfordii]
MADPDLSMKLLVDTKGRRILFAEASKDVVDFLFNLLSLPLGTSTRILTPKGMVGGIGNLYQSIEDLKDTYMLPGKSKDSLLKPAIPNKSPLSLTSDQSSEPKSFYRCSNTNYSSCRQYVTRDPKANCPNCKSAMAASATYVDSVNEVSSSAEGGFVKGVVTYMIMDDLEVKPMSTISGITVLNKFNVKELGSLEEKVINLTIDEGKKLLSAALQSKTVLTDVFFEEKITLD